MKKYPDALRTAKLLEASQDEDGTWTIFNSETGEIIAEGIKFGKTAHSFLFMMNPDHPWGTLACMFSFNTEDSKLLHYGEIDTNAEVSFV